MTEDTRLVRRWNKQICACGNYATHTLRIELGCYDQVNDRMTFTPAVLNLCDQCWAAEQEQAQAMLGRGEWTLSGVTR